MMRRRELTQLDAGLLPFGMQRTDSLVSLFLAGNGHGFIVVLNVVC